MAKKKLVQGAKYDQEKIRMDLIPVLGLLLEGDVYTIGGKKYDVHNWRKGIAYSRILGAMFRHMLWFAAGESFDPEDGQHHLASVRWAANALMEYEVTHPEMDDRYIPFPPTKIREILNNMRQPNVQEKPKKRTASKQRKK